MATRENLDPAAHSPLDRGDRTLLQGTTLFFRTRPRVINKTSVNLKSPLPLGRLRVAIALFAVGAGFYWKITFTSQFDWVWGPDLATQVMPWFAVQARSWHQGTFPLWDPFLWAGQPLPGQAQPGAAYPLNWLLFKLPLDHGQISAVALQWYFVMIRLSHRQLRVSFSD